MSSSPTHDTIADVAALLAARVKWEMEHGADGYRLDDALPPSIEKTQQIPPSTDSKIPPTQSPETEQSLSSAPASPNQTAEITSSNKTISTDTVAPHSQKPKIERIDNHAALEALRKAIGDCTRCVLHAGRTNLVFGEGNPNADLVFVGEGPGRNEDLAGRPFVGAAGQLLDRIISAMGFSRETVYICNVVKCHPPGNRTPESTESRICGPFVQRQLAIVNPKAVVALGKTAAAYLLDTDAPISRLRGQFHTINHLQIMPTFHPAYLLRNPGAKREVWHDMQQVMALINTGKERE